MTKKSFSALLIVILMLFITACGPNKGGDKEPDASADGSKDAPKKEYFIKFSTNTSDAHPLGQGALKFKELIEERTDGQIKVQIYPSLQLGSLREQIEQVQLGSVEITMAALATMTNFVEDVQIIVFPFLWPDEDKMWDILNGEIGDAVYANMKNEGMIGFGTWPNGFMQMTSKSKPIQSTDDLKGFKMRVIPAPLLIAQYEAWGANPVPIDFSEVYTSLQQGVVDGQENPLTTISDQKYVEVQDYLTLTNHSYQASIFTVNKKWFDSLPADLQQIFKESEKEARLFAIEKSKELNQQILDDMEKSGSIKINELSAEASRKFEELSKPLHASFSKTDYQKELLQKVYKAIEEAK